MTDEQMDARLRAAGLAFRGGEEHPGGVATAEPGHEHLEHGELIELTVEEPFDLTVAAPRRRHRPAVLMLSAAAVAIALVVGTVLAVRGIGGDHQRGVAGSGPADQLVGRTWTFTDVEDAEADGASSGRSASPGISLTFDRDGTVTVVLRQITEQVQARIRADRITFSGLDVVSTGTPRSSDDQSQFDTDKALIETYLSGSVTWAVQDGQLRLSLGIRSLLFDEPAGDRSPAPGVSSGP